MKYLFLIICMLFTFNTTSNEKKVYLCTGGWAKCYHYKKDCEGLQHCGGAIKEVTIEEAKKMGRGKPCGYCVR
jgi:hypothetical protein